MEVLYDYMTLSLDHTHDLDLGSFKVSVWNNLFSGRGWPIDMERKGCELSIHAPWYWLVTSVTMVGWVDVPDSDRGDFRRWHAVDIPSYYVISGSYLNPW